MSEVEGAVDALAACRAPLLIGVRHHSPACAAAVPALLDAFAPERLFVELPHELEPWLAWLGHAELKPPVALAAARSDGGLWFYPFADFSPELAAVRWALARGVPVEAFDLPYGERDVDRADEGDHAAHAPARGEGQGVLPALAASEGVDGSEALWDRLVEARAPAANAESVRRAALSFGWAVRRDAHEGAGVPRHDLRREAYMRSRLADRRERAAAVVGSFHASALIDPPFLGESLVHAASARASVDVVSSLVPYSFELFDARSGYPAGIRDPLWQQRAWSAARSGASLDDVAREVIVEVARDVRRMGHIAGVPDAREASRMAVDLARLRGLPGPGRREVLESIESALGRGEPLGRGRVLARALDRVMVGRARGKLAPGTPRSGLAPHVGELLAELSLPGPGAATRDPESVTLDPLRSPLDRRRHVAIERLLACGVPYATREDRGEADNLTARWKAQWTPSIEALLELAGVRGVTLAQAAEGALRAKATRHEEEGGLTARARLVGLEGAARAGLVSLTEERLHDLVGRFHVEAGLAELVEALALVERIGRGLFPGLPLEWDGPPGEIHPFAFPRGVERSDLLAAAVAALEGLSGSTRDEDATAMLELSRLRGELDDPGGRLGWTLDRLAAEGSPKMQGAAGAVRVLLGRDDGAHFGVRVGSWIDAGGDLASRVRGTMLVAPAVLEGDPAFLAAISARVGALEDGTFLERLPALREGFDALSPASRARLLAALFELIGPTDNDPSGRGLDVELEDAPEVAGWLAQADAEGRAALLRRRYPMPDGPPLSHASAAPPLEAHAVQGDAASARALSLVDRWRLVLGRERERLSPRALPASIALDELYGRGRGEGSRGDLSRGRGGKEAPFPTVREWSGELEALFGAHVREEVLARAGSRGRAAAVLTLDADRVQPSVELLETLLSLKGGLPESQLSRLRALVDRIVKALVAELATSVRPALAGLTTPRPSRRRSGILDLSRTVASNLRTARRESGGGVKLLPERLVWKTRARRSMDWHLTLIVDVSGSMEPSVIYAAMMAAILNTVPALSVQFLAFNTQVVDMSERVDDPLGLLLEIAVGGGTDIGQALAYARGRLRVPARSLVVVVSDFEEGGDVNVLVAEARALVETGARLLGLAALDDIGKPRYQRAIAELLVGAGMPIAALTPLELARWVGEQIR